MRLHMMMSCQISVAEIANVDSGFLTHIEHAKKASSLDTLVKIARALSVPVSPLFKAPPGKTHDAAYAEIQQVHSLPSDRTPAQKADLLSILKRLRDPETIRALKKLIGR